MKRDLIKKIICCTAITTSLITIFPLNIYAATWLNDNMGNYYFYESNNYVVGWRNIDGTVYYFDASGVMQKGWIQYGDSWYYLDNNGALKTGWIKYNGEWYYSDSAGIMQTGTLQINGQTYCFGNNGVMKRGSVIINGQFYTIGVNGAIISNTAPVPDKVFDSNNNCIQQITSTENNVVKSPNSSKYDNPIEDQSEIGDYEEPKQEFTVIFRDENGEELKKKEVKDGNTVKMYEPDDENAESSSEGREFLEWNTKRDGSGKGYDEDDKVKVTKDLTLYAIWKEQEEKIEVTSITISGENKVSIGSEIQLTADVRPSDATNTKVKWSIVSSTDTNAGTATIDSNGVLRGTKIGKITVKAEASDNSDVSTTKTIEVVEAKNNVTGITIATKNGLHVINTDGGKLEFIATVTPDNADNKDVKWVIVEGSQYADIDSKTGVLTAYSDTPTGKFVKVKAVAEDGSGTESSNTIDVSITNQSIKASSVSVYGKGNLSSVAPNGILYMIAEVNPSGFKADGAEVKWTAEYTDSNITTGASIRAVSATEAGIEKKDNQQYAELKVGQSGQIKVAVEVTKNGVTRKNSTIIKINKEATGINVTAKYDGGSAIDIVDGKFTIDMEHGENGDKNVILKASISPSDADTKSITWSLKDPSYSTYAELDTSSGNNVAILKPKNDVGDIQEQTITLVAKANDKSGPNKDGIEKEIDVTIKNPKISATAITLKNNGNPINSGTVFNILKGQSITVTADITPTNSTTKHVEWINSLANNRNNYSNYVTIESSNTTTGSQITITPKANKELPVECLSVIVTAKADKAEKQQFIVNIYNNPQDMKFNYYTNYNGGSSLTGRTLIVGETIKIQAAMTPSNLSGSNITWNTGTNFERVDSGEVINNNTSTIKVLATTPGQASCTATYTIMDKDKQPIFDATQEPSSSKTLQTAEFTILPKIDTITVSDGTWSDETILLEKDIEKAIALPNNNNLTVVTGSYNWDQYKEFFELKPQVFGEKESVTAKIVGSQLILKRSKDLTSDTKVTLILVPKNSSILPTIELGSIKIGNMQTTPEV